LENWLNTEKNPLLDGRVSVPLLVPLIVYVYVSPTVTCAGPVIVSETLMDVGWDELGTAVAPRPITGPSKSKARAAHIPRRAVAPTER
jgi:hypothetical protein